jgi:5-methyltetrahydropteroyltriglutamate--homocysteine methyltransferase
MLTNNLGYPRIGSNRELKKACEKYWAGKLSVEELAAAGKNIRLENWKAQQQAGIDLIPVNDFSFYDQVLDLTLALGAIPERYQALPRNGAGAELDLYFAMARGYQKNGLDITALEMTKWFDTNYHYLVPEFHGNQTFQLLSNKVVQEYGEAIAAGIAAKPVLLGPVSYLLLGKEKEAGFHRIDLLPRLLPVYIRLLQQLAQLGATWVQLDEPCLALDLTAKEQEAFETAYQQIAQACPELSLLLANYFDCYGDNLKTALSLPVQALHLDLVRCPSQLEDVLQGGRLSPKTSLSLGVVDGRNIWKNDFNQSLSFIQRAVAAIGPDRVMISASCSLLHVPCDLELETDPNILRPEIKQWLAFARQKIEELLILKQLAHGSAAALEKHKENQQAGLSRRNSALIHNEVVKKRVRAITAADVKRLHPFALRREAQQKALRLPLFPTTTIGSFPQTTQVRGWRGQLRKGEITPQQYETLLKAETEKAIRWQEEIDLDVLVHGEFERNDMVEYFGEQLAGFAFTQNGWVQSYGSRCVKPPVIYGDVHRPAPMTVFWSAYAQSLTPKQVKGMLTGPVTILQWSFVRNDQPRAQTCTQIALAIRDEVQDLEKAGIKIIQIDEPALREGLPLRKADWQHYLEWAVRAFSITASGVKDETQIHTHMCYSEFNDIIRSIADMDADVITIECSRSQMELLDAFADFKYPNEIGPGVYDIHSPRVPAKAEMVRLLKKAQTVIPAAQLWVNPDCGLKTRHWEETQKALAGMVAAAKEVRQISPQPLLAS